jgi:hypothetical protein
VRDDGVVQVEFLDQGLNTTQTVVGIDFLAVRAIIDGAQFDLKNSSPSTIHIIAIWVVNSTLHQRYTANVYMNSAQQATFVRADISLPKTDFVVKVVTERGNEAVFPQ